MRERVSFLLKLIVCWSSCVFGEAKHAHKSSPFPINVIIKNLKKFFSLVFFLNVILSTWSRWFQCFILWSFYPIVFQVACVVTLYEMCLQTQHCRLLVCSWVSDWTTVSCDSQSDLNRALCDWISTRKSPKDLTNSGDLLAGTTNPQSLKEKVNWWVFCNLLWK